jgi:hypothetical protein
MYKKIIMATIITILLAAMALPVLAKPPDHFSDWYAEIPMPIADCGDYVVESKDFIIYMNGTKHYDKDGNLIKIITHWSGEGIYWRPDTGKEVYMDSNLFNSIDILETGETISAGIQFKITLPGEGTIFMDVGRMVFKPYPNIIFEAGQHPFFFPEEGGLEKICAYFAD